jgi:hypothetical protein
MGVVGDDSYQCEVERLQAQNIAHNEAFLKSLNLEPLNPRYALIGKHLSLKARLRS